MTVAIYLLIARVALVILGGMTAGLILLIAYLRSK